jgi:PAS domain S-box-containing protein
MRKVQAYQFRQIIIHVAIDFTLNSYMNTDTDQKISVGNQLRQEIAADDQYYRSIIENNSFYVIKTDLQGNYTYMNPFFCQKFELDGIAWTGRSSLELIIAEDHPACLATVEKCFTEMGKEQWVILRKPFNGTIVSTQWEFKLLPDEHGNPVEILCIGHDITSLILKQQELQQLADVTAEQNKKLVNFTYIVSHNIRSHVANIIGIVNLNEEGDDEDKEVTWEILKKSVSSLDSTIHNLNDIINIQSNTNLSLTDIKLKPEIERIVDSIKVLFTNAVAKINYNFDEDAYLATNPAYLESIILNLLTNSLKYKSPSRPLEIDISFFKKGGYYVFIFKDNGLGIDLSKHGEKIFGMYKTFNGNLDAKGLGLFIIKTQIETLGGKIEVESEVDQYTAFKVYFKIA